MDLNNIQKSMTRERIDSFLSELGIDPDDFCMMVMYPKRVVLTRYVNNEATGERVLDHLGPRTVDSHFAIIKDGDN